MTDWPKFPNCGCCGDPNAKESPVPHTVNGNPERVAYCKDHWVNCFHTPGWGPNGEDWDDDEPGYLAQEAQFGAEWDVLPARQ